MTARHQVAFIDLSISDHVAFDGLSNSAEAHSMTATQKREIVFIDRGVDDLATLLAGIRPDVEPFLLSNDEASTATDGAGGSGQGRAGGDPRHCAWTAG